MRTLKIVGAILGLAIAAGCGTSASDLAKKDAMTMAYNIANTKMTGDQSKEQLIAIETILAKNKLNFTDISRSRGEIADKVRLNYANDAKERTNQLRATHAKPEEAKAMKTEIDRYLKAAGKSSGEIGTSDAELSRLVARNGLEFAQRNAGGTISPSTYIAAGLPVPTITRTRTVIQRVPVRPAVAKKAPAKKPTRSNARAHKTR